MVRINLINPKYLADQHLIAEYVEIMMLFGYVKKYPIVEENKMPGKYCLGKGHIIFFKNKLMYLKKRHELLKKEMKKRNFETKKTIFLKKFSNKLINDWKPLKTDKEIIKKRLLWKIMKKPEYYRYYGEKKTKTFWKEIIKNAK